MRRLLARLGLFAVVIALLAPVTRAQPPAVAWERLAGPFGGAALGVASVPAGADVVAVATDGAALYRSTDAATWTQIPLAPSGFTGVAATPDGAFWSTGTDVLRSSDGGVSWAPAGAGLPADGARSIAGLADGTAVAATSSGVFRRAPGAASWQPTAFAEPTSVVAVVPAGPGADVLLAGLASTGIGSTVYSVARSSDGGASWQTVPVGTYRPAEVTGLAVLADGSALMGGYPTSDTGRAASPHRSTDAGLTWTPVAGLPVGFVVSHLAAAGRTTAATGYSPESFVSSDGGVTWATVPLVVTGLAAGPGVDLLVATSRRGLLRAPADVSTATDATAGFGRAAVSQVEVRGDLVVAARLADYGVGTGLHRSPDRGATWSRIDLPFATRGLSDLHLDAAGRLFAVPDRCFDAACAPSGVYRSLDGGETWAATSLALPGSSTPGRLASGPDGALWALVVTRALYRSLDGGETWEPRSPAPHSKTFTVGDDGTLWVGSDQPEVSVSRSLDGGLTWQTALAPSPGLRTGAIVVARSGAVVVGARGVGYRSADGGQTWATISFGFAQPFHELDVLRRGPDGTLFAGADGGAPVHRSLDDGLTWAPVADGLPEAAPALDLAVGSDGVLWAALGTGGLFRTTTSTVASEGPGRQSSPLALAVAPNPTRGGATVTLTVDSPSDLTVSVVDALGRRVAVLHDGTVAAGALTLRVGALPPGVYVVRATVGREAATQRLVVVR